VLDRPTADHRRALEVRRRPGRRLRDALAGREARLRLVVRDERATAAVAEQHDLLDAELLAQVAHARGDVEHDLLVLVQRVVARMARGRREHAEACVDEAWDRVVVCEVDARMDHDDTDLRRTAMPPQRAQLAHVVRAQDQRLDVRLGCTPEPERHAHPVGLADQRHAPRLHRSRVSAGLRRPLRKGC